MGFDNNHLWALGLWVLSFNPGVGMDVCCGSEYSFSWFRSVSLTSKHKPTTNQIADKNLPRSFTTSVSQLKY